MPVIDTRLAEIQVLQRKYQELNAPQSQAAIMMARQMAALQSSLARDMAPLKAMIVASSILS